MITEKLRLLIREIELNRIGMINLDRKDIHDDDSMKALAAALQTNTSVTFISFTNTNMGADGVKALAATLHNNTSVTRIFLSGNNIGDDGAKTLAAALKTNTRLIEISLTDNSIGADGVKALTSALKPNTRLTTIFLSGANIGDDGAKALAAALQTNTKITKIHLPSNNMGADGAKALAAALQTSTTVTEINLARNNIGADGAKALATALKINTSLTAITLDHNNIGTDGAEALAAALKTNTSLSKIELFQCNIDLSTMRQIRNLELRNKHLAYMPYTTHSTDNTRTNLSVSPFISTKKAHKNMDPIVFEFSGTKEACVFLLNWKGDINQWIESNSTPAADDIPNLHATYMANIAYVHLRCVTPYTDTTPITQLNRNVLAASAAMAQIPKEHPLYKTLCLHLGSYYCSRALNFTPNNETEKKMQQAFAKSALNYWQVALQDNAFSAKDNLVGELSMPIAELISLVVPNEKSEFTHSDNQKLLKDPAWDKALNTAIPNERKPSDLPPTNAASIDTELRQTLETAPLHYFNRLLEEAVKSSKNSNSIGMFSSASSTDVSLWEGIMALKDACNGTQVDAVMLERSIRQIRKSEHCEHINQFLSQHPLCIHGNNVSTFNGLAATLTTIASSRNEL